MGDLLGRTRGVRHRHLCLLLMIIAFAPLTMAIDVHCSDSETASYVSAVCKAYRVNLFTPQTNLTDEEATRLAASQREAFADALDHIDPPNEVRAVHESQVRRQREIVELIRTNGWDYFRRQPSPDAVKYPSAYTEYAGDHRECNAAGSEIFGTTTIET